MSRVILGAVLLLAAVLTGCGGSSGGTGATVDPTAFGTRPPIAYAREPDRLVLRVMVGGGLLPPGFHFAELPSLSLLGDGRLITPGAVPAIFPGPALTPLSSQRLNERGIQQVLRAARNAGLDHDLGDLGRPTIADAPTTQITFVSADGLVVNSIYALGIEQGGTTAGGPTQAQRAARQRVTAFLTKLGDVEAWLGDDVGPSQEDVLPALAVQITRRAPDETDTGGVTPNVLAWPLGDLATLGSASPVVSMPEPPAGVRQAVVTGRDLERLRPLLRQATQITTWSSGGRDYHLTFRPLLPDEAAAVE